MFIFTEDGTVKHVKKDGDFGMVIADKHRIAREFVDYYKRKMDTEILISALDSVDGGTLEDQLANSMKQGANGVFLLHKVGSDKVEYKFMKAQNQSPQ